MQRGLEKKLRKNKKKSNINKKRENVYIRALCTTDILCATNHKSAKFILLLYKLPLNKLRTLNLSVVDVIKNTEFPNKFWRIKDSSFTLSFTCKNKTRVIAF